MTTNTGNVRHYHCATCGRRLETTVQNVVTPLLVCTDNEDCYQKTPPRYRRWNGFKYVPDPARAEACEEEDCEPARRPVGD